MSIGDIIALHEMQQEINSDVGQNLSRVAENLLFLRDSLQFKDDKWYKDFTHNVVTLDFASTYRPGSEAEKRQAEIVIKEDIQRLIFCKL